MSSRDRFEDLATWVDGEVDLSVIDREQQMEIDAYVEKLKDVVRRATEAGMTLEQSKTLMFQWLLAAQEEDVAAVGRVLPDLSPDQLRLIVGYRALDQRDQRAVLGAVERVVNKGKQDPIDKAVVQEVLRGRYNIFGDVTNIADTMSNVFFNGREVPGNKS